MEIHLFYLCIRILNITITLTQVALLFKFILGQISDLTKVSENLYYSVTQIAFICKMTNFMLNWKELLKLEDTLNSIIFTDDEEEEKLMMKLMNFSRLQSKIFRFLCIVSIFFYSLKPFFERNVDGSRKLPLTISLPFDENEYYYQIYFVSVFSVGLGAFLNSNLDILFITLITLGSGRLEILKHKLENVVSGQRESDEILEQDMKQCARQLNDIYWFVYFKFSMFVLIKAFGEIAHTKITYIVM